MKLLKKLACVLLCVSLLLNCANITFVEDNTTVEDEIEIPTEGKTIYNFERKEEKMRLDYTYESSEEPVTYYRGYKEHRGFNFTSNTFDGFEHGTLFVRRKGAASGGTYVQSAYGNNGEFRDGVLDTKNMFSKIMNILILLQTVVVLYMWH